ncbi:flagellar hook-basal body complex protein FliE [Buchnera aphidicola]|uniref:Flagellar hook-basal body complex protein FliE n=1 Tax=Buchnera aphidicola (Cinara cf. splendens/pseudotsugae 3390) TaxID=2518980 RepID=A0A451CWX9_9GAMM|nr:flagellar hook-basal body complex protein FliE [Buchnera aphidicola]VFP77613.1 Flagellar hook-basal body complex protein FliE [Buchnera aphidicola (Cinara cf. splendens/pseudotsugae 3390)]
MKINSIQPQSIQTISSVSNPKNIKNKNFLKISKNTSPELLNTKKIKNNTKEFNLKNTKTKKNNKEYKINMLLKIQNKLINLYEEIMNMQI